jgi:hypothetical protein
MRVTAVAFVPLAICCFGIVACASKAQTNPGDPAVYAKIQDSTSCTDLQVILDRAGVDRRAALSRSNTDLADVTLAYMRAADKRMTELHCTGSQ